MTEATGGRRWRELDLDTDGDALVQIWREIGWLEDPDKAVGVKTFYSAGRTIVADVHGRAECAVKVCPGAIAYQSERLSMAAVTAVATSHVARKQGLATELTAAALSRAGADGYATAGLGMFEQGYYDRFGFGTLSYESAVTIDPATLAIDAPFSPPLRFTLDDADDMHAALLRRLRGHGGCSVDVANTFRGELQLTSNWFALGYRDAAASDRISHFILFSTEDEHGPYNVDWLAYESREQLMQLMALVASLGEQVATVRIREPAHLQLQDLVRQPFRRMTIGRGGKHAAEHHSLAYCQLRMLDPAACLERTHLVGPSVRFNLELNDPLDALLPDDDPDLPWRGCGGRWRVELGADSSAERGDEPGLPTLRASVGAFTRLWLGVRAASVLRLSDELAAEDALIEQLDDAVRLPPTRIGYEF